LTTKASREIFQAPAKKKLGPIQLCTVCNMTIAARAHESKGIITKRMSWRL